MSGTADAEADAHVTGFSAEAWGHATVAGESVSEATASIGAHALPALITDAQAVSLITGLPGHSAADANLLASGASHAQSAFSTSGSFYFAAGELGVASAVGDSAVAYTQSSHFDFTVDLSKLGIAAQNDLVFGFYDPVASGTFDDIDLTISINGSKSLDQRFATIQQAATFLTDDVVNLGKLSGDTLSVSVDLAAQSPAHQHGAIYLEMVVGSALLV
jgi:hypothetical protein